MAQVRTCAEKAKERSKADGQGRKEGRKGGKTVKVLTCARKGPLGEESYAKTVIME